ncbi:serine acetyltransferase CysE [Gottschalkia purinilytica]|uniref:Serine acetyltransferase n=1 Tax=Gottschalkia purinilytica TaxID=1503 RepID=A0A0L0W987_GOTPU|nr:serine O-acetyltransferase [Gottschalkia purinilytica]KNF07996.1 serine acetyltransferase CysE [Gottschalkia purinilytica]
MFKNLREDINAIKSRDPAVRTSIEALLCYPGLHAITIHRLAHWLYNKRFFLIARILSNISRFFTGIEIHPGAKLGKGVFIDHGTGVVIGETAEVGENVTIYQGVTLGGTGKDTGKRHPTIGKNVVVSSGAKVLGPFKVGDNSKIGAGAVVLKEVPPNCTVVGVPGRIVIKDNKKVEPEKKEMCIKDKIDLDQVGLPDPVAQEIDTLKKKIKDLETYIEQMQRRDK